MPFATFCDELKVFNSEEPFNYYSSVKVTEKPNLYGNISWSGDATWLTVTPSSDPLAIFKYENEQLLPHRFVNYNDVKSATFLNWTNKDLVFGLENGEIRIWNIRDKTVSCVVDAGPKQPVNFLTCNLDDTCIASGSLSSNRIGLHSLRTNKYLRSLELPNGELTSCLKFCQCKKGYLAASTSASTVCVYDVVKSQVIFNSPNAHQGACSGLEFSPINFSVLATVSLSKRLKLFDLRKNNRICDILLNEPLHCVDIFQQGDKVAVGTSKGTIFIYDLRASKISKTIKAYNDVITALSINKLERIRKQHNSEMNSAEAPPPSNRTLDLSVMDVFSPIVRDAANGNVRNSTGSSANNTHQLTATSATNKIQNDSFLCTMLSPRPFPMLMSSPIDPCLPAHQIGQQEISIYTPQIIQQDASGNLSSVQENISGNPATTVQPVTPSVASQQNTMSRQFRGRPNGRVHQLQTNYMGRSVNPAPAVHQETGSDADGATPEARHVDTQQWDICMDSLLKEVHAIQEEQDVSFKLMYDQMSLVEESVMNKISVNHNTITDILLNVIKPDAERAYFELKYDLVTQRNFHMDGFNMLAERTENIASLLSDLTQQVNALQNIILNNNREQ